MSAPSDRASTLLLFPAGVLVVMLLSAIAVDLSHVHAAQRELQRRIDAAADDAGSLVDLEALYSEGSIAVDLDAARRSVARDLSGLAGIGSVTTSVTLGARPDTIVVRARGEVEHLFGRVVPGMPRTQEITASVSAVLGIRPVEP